MLTFPCLTSIPLKMCLKPSFDVAWHGWKDSTRISMRNTYQVRVGYPEFELGRIHILLLYSFRIPICPPRFKSGLQFSLFFYRHFLQGQSCCSIPLLKILWIAGVQFFNSKDCLEFFLNGFPPSLPHKINSPDLEVRIELGNIGIQAPVISHPGNKFLQKYVR